MAKRKIDRKTLVLSYSAAKRYWDCPGSYFKRYIIREKPPESEDITGTAPGLIVDRLAQYFFQRIQEGKGSGRFMFDSESKVFKETFDRYVRRPGVFLGEGAFAENEEEALEFIGGLAQNLSDMITQEQLSSADLILSEVSKDGGFKVENPTSFGTYKKPLVINDWLMIAGGFDLYTQHENAAGRLIDYKASYSKRNLDPHQLKLYQIALKKKWDLPVAMAGFMLFNMKKMDWYRFSDEDLEGTEDKFTNTAKSILREEFDLTPSKSACRLCPYRTSCSESVLPESTKTKKVSRPKVKAVKPESLDETPEL